MSTKVEKRVSTRRLALAILAVFVSSAAAVWFGFGSSIHRAPVASYSLIPPGSLAAPLPFGQRTTLAGASSMLGTNIVLPNTAQISTSALGGVWIQLLAGGQDVTAAVTFPSAGLIVQYQRPAPYSSSAALQLYQAMANEEPNSISVTDVNGVPALAIKQNSDTTGANLGSVDFVSGDTRIAVIGHYDESSLRSFAASVLAVAAG